MNAARLLGTALALCCGCSLSAGGPDYAELGVVATDEAGELTTDVSCTSLPVLPGGEVKRELHFGDAFRLQLRAGRDEVELVLENVVGPTEVPRTISADRLRAGHADRYDVTGSDGERYVLSLFAPCTEGDSP